MKGKRLIGQSYLVQLVEELFPQHKVIVGAKKAAGLQVNDNNSYLEVDVWIPEIGLAFEYQEPHHYENSWFVTEGLTDLQHRDIIKTEFLQRRGDTIIKVPYWWDGAKESLIGTIRQHREDLLQNYYVHSANIIPSAPPLYQESVPDIGSLMLASFSDNISFDDSRQWWLGEKYDGVRLCWNHVRKFLYNRAGKPVPCEALSSHFPSINIDGEIWLGRKSYSELANNRGESLSPFSRVNAFDSPPASSHSLSTSPLPSVPSLLEYEARYSLLVSHLPSSHPFLTLAACQKCKSKEKMKQYLKWIVESEGEGAIARSHGSLYENTRSSNLLKLKTFRDVDGLVVEINHNDATCELTLTNNTICTAQVPLTLIDSLHPGDIISCTYNPSATSTTYEVYRKRHDKNYDEFDWQSTSEKWERRDEREVSLNIETKRAISDKSTNKPKGYWTGNEGIQNMRRVFDEFAKGRGLDPIDPNTWYKLGRNETLYEIEGGYAIVNHYKSFKHALVETYPDIGLEESNFDFVPSNYWAKRDNVASLFNRVAVKMGFDPHKEYEKWYEYSASEIERVEKAVHYVVWEVCGSLSKALADCYPNIHFDESKFPKKKIWEGEKEKRKLVFDNLAKLYSFDPFRAINWIKRRQFLMKTHKEFHNLMNYYSFSLRTALSDIYLSIDWSNVKKTRGFATL